MHPAEVFSHPVREVGRAAVSTLAEICVEQGVRVGGRSDGKGLVEAVLERIQSFHVILHVTKHPGSGVADDTVQHSDRVDQGQPLLERLEPEVEIHVVGQVHAVVEAHGGARRRRNAVQLAPAAREFEQRDLELRAEGQRQTAWRRARRRDVLDVVDDGEQGIDDPEVVAGGARQRSEWVEVDVGPPHALLSGIGNLDAIQVRGDDDMQSSGQGFTQHQLDRGERGRRGGARLPIGQDALEPCVATAGVATVRRCFDPPGRDQVEDLEAVCHQAGDFRAWVGVVVEMERDPSVGERRFDVLCGHGSRTATRGDVPTVRRVARRGWGDLHFGRGEEGEGRAGVNGVCAGGACRLPGEVDRRRAGVAGGDHGARVRGRKPIIIASMKL